LDSDNGEDLADRPSLCFGAAREVRKYHIPDFSNWKNQNAFEYASGVVPRLPKPNAAGYFLSVKQWMPHDNCHGWRRKAGWDCSCWRCVGR
jgi:hypothetical protein